MPRVRLNLPSTFLYSTELAVRVTDLNYGGHLGNDALLGLVHEARVRFLDSLGYSEKDIEGVGLIMVDALIVYKAEAFHGDRLRIDVAVDDVGEHGCDFLYRVTVASTGREVSRVKTGVAFYDYAARRVAPTPAPFRSAVQPPTVTS